MCGQFIKYVIPLVLCLVLGGCPGANTGGNAPPGGDEVTPDGGDADTNQDPGVDGDDNDGQPAGAVALRGRINPGQAAKRRPRLQGAELYSYTVVAQSDATGVVYRGATSEEGDFQIDIPADEAGNSFMVTILGPDGRAVGPVILDAANNEGATGLAMERDADLGTLDLPDDPTQAPIAPGADGDVADLVDHSITARLNDNGVPVGLGSVGKGADAVAETNRAEGVVDTDGDGLIDMLDADDDGNGIVDDFDAGGDAGPRPPDVQANFFMNLKVQAELAPAYYAGTPEEIAARLAQDTVITFEVLGEPNASRTIASARLLETPGPAYLTGATTTGNVPGSPALWSEANYAFVQQSDRFYVFVCPNAVMDAGDSFTVEITFDDSTVEQYCRMINYVFKNIPKLLQYGPPGNLTAFDVTDPNTNGTHAQPIPVDGTQDLILVFEPPPDETGAPITGMNYSFQMFYFGDGGQLNQDIDVQATWPSPVPGLDRTMYWVWADELGDLSPEGTYTVTLPRDVFPDTVTLTSGQPAAVEFYKIDITAEAPTGNAAIMLAFVRE
jgi:hypothetical protein